MTTMRSTRAFALNQNHSRIRGTHMFALIRAFLIKHEYTLHPKAVITSRINAKRNASLDIMIQKLSVGCPWRSSLLVIFVIAVVRDRTDPKYFAHAIRSVVIDRRGHRSSSPVSCRCRSSLCLGTYYWLLTIVSTIATTTITTTATTTYDGGGEYYC